MNEKSSIFGSDPEQIKKVVTKMKEALAAMVIK